MIKRPSIAGKNNHKWKHGYATQGNAHALYKIWRGILARCEYPKNPSFPWYGAKGITVCDEWHEFSNFIRDMGSSWVLGLEIDRIDSKGHYEPSNCRWATRAEQLRNTSRNTFYELNGVKKCAIDWAKDLGANHRIIAQRLKLGWTLDVALTTPVDRRFGKRGPRCTPS